MTIEPDSPRRFTSSDITEAKRLAIAIFYESPWERLMCWAHGIDRRTNEIVKYVPEGSWRDCLAVWCDSRDSAWRNRYAKQNRDPNKRWKRRN